MGQMIQISVCLDEIPDSVIFTAQNGKRYVSLNVDEKKETDQWGKTHSVSISQTKEERERKVKKVYIGNGKAFNFNANSQSGTSTPTDKKVAENGSKQHDSEYDDNLPF